MNGRIGPQTVSECIFYWNGNSPVWKKATTCGACVHKNTGNVNLMP